MKTLEEKKRDIDEYFADKDPADYGAIRIGPVGPPGAHVIGRTYDTTSLIVIRLDENGLRLSDGNVSEDVSDKTIEEIIETIEDWAQTLREEVTVK